MRVALFVGLLLLAGCAIGHVRTESGATLTGFALGHARLSCCDVPPPGPDGPVPETCVQIEGGALSHNFTETMSVIASVAVAILTTGLLF